MTNASHLVRSHAKHVVGVTVDGGLYAAQVSLYVSPPISPAHRLILQLLKVPTRQHQALRSQREKCAVEAEVTWICSKRWIVPSAQMSSWRRQDHLGQGESTVVGNAVNAGLLLQGRLGGNPRSNMSLDQSWWCIAG